MTTNFQSCLCLLSATVIDGMLPLILEVGGAVQVSPMLGKHVISWATSQAPTVAIAVLYTLFQLTLKGFSLLNLYT